MNCRASVVLLLTQQRAPLPCSALPDKLWLDLLSQTHVGVQQQPGRAWQQDRAGSVPAVGGLHLICVQMLLKFKYLRPKMTLEGHY